MIYEKRATRGQRLQLRAPVFLTWVPNNKINIAENSENLRLECAESNRYRATAASMQMDSFVVFFAEVVFERLDKMKKIIEHPKLPTERESNTLRLPFATYLG